jgi:hypothetical protein
MGGGVLARGVGNNHTRLVCPLGPGRGGDAVEEAGLARWGSNRSANRDGVKPASLGVSPDTLQLAMP